MTEEKLEKKKEKKDKSEKKEKKEKSEKKEKKEKSEKKSEEKKRKREDNEEEPKKVKSSGENSFSNDKFLQENQITLEGENIPKYVSSFEELNFDSKILKQLEKLNFKTPTPIQKVALPIAMKQRDGKTKL
jgi:ATP-dependent RNA helicase DBP3